MENRVIKQYTYGEGGFGRRLVRTYINGVQETAKVVKDVEFGEYTHKLYEQGYEFVYSIEDVEEYKKLYLKYKEAYERAINNTVYGYKEGE